MQAQGEPTIEHYRSSFDCYVGIYRNRGVLGFYRGLAVNLVRVAPNTGIQFLVFETLKEKTH